MKKIPTVFERDEQDRRYVTNRPNPACDWVFAGEGVPTLKYDGTCMMFDGSRWWARREVKPGKTPPPEFVQADHDETTGKTVGWEPIERSPFAKFHTEALAETSTAVGQRGWPAGTYELVGPKINGNRERLEWHELWLHAAAPVVCLGLRTFDAIREQVLDLGAKGCEGIVYHHPDGRMAKIKASDFRPESDGGQK